MRDPWRYRCPEDHASIERRSDGYYCRVCEAYYTGDPVDAKRDESPEADGGRTTPHIFTAVERLWKVTGDTETTARARHVSDRPRMFTVAMREAADCGLVERIDSSGGDRWRVTESARWLVARPARGEA